MDTNSEAAQLASETSSEIHASSGITLYPNLLNAARLVFFSFVHSFLSLMKFASIQYEQDWSTAKPPMDLYCSFSIQYHSNPR